MRTALVILVVALAVTSTTARKSKSCGKRNNKCCERNGVRTCDSGLTCTPRWKCVPAPKPSPSPSPVPAPVPPPVPAPVPGPGPVTGGPGPVPGVIVPGIQNPGFPGFTGVGGPVPAVGGPVATGALSGSGIAQIASGTAGTLGTGDVFSTKAGGGAATAVGSQQAFVNGVGPAAGQTQLAGGADLITPGGGRSTAAGNSGNAFLLGGGPGEASSTNSFATGVTPLTATGKVVNGATGTAAGGAAVSNNFGLIGVDP